jgi:hypothetical protein
MLSSSPAVPLHSIDWSDDTRRRLSLTTAGGHRITTHDGLPSPDQLIPVTGTPHASRPGSASMSRRGSDMALTSSSLSSASPTPAGEYSDYGFSALSKVPSREGGMWHEGVSASLFSLFLACVCVMCVSCGTSDSLRSASYSCACSCSCLCTCSR